MTDLTSIFLRLVSNWDNTVVVESFNSWFSCENHVWHAISTLLLFEVLWVLNKRIPLLIQIVSCNSWVISIIWNVNDLLSEYLSVSLWKVINTTLLFSTSINQSIDVILYRVYGFCRSILHFTSCLDFCLVFHEISMLLSNSILLCNVLVEDELKISILILQFFFS